MVLDFEVPIEIELNQEQKEQLIKKINLYYLNDEECNKFENDKIKSKYPEKETKEYKDAIFSANACHLKNATISFSLKRGVPVLVR